MRQIPAVEDVENAEATVHPVRRRRRIALYSHDTQGLGHVRRTSLLARAVVAADPDADVLLLSGAAEATSLPLPERTEVVTLPRVGKHPDAGYGPRAWGGTLDETVRVRAGVLDGTLAAFRPDVLVVDKVPLGVGGELLPALRRLRAEGTTAIVLGLRDVLDTPDVAVREWDEQRSSSVIARYYDQVWVYGDAQVYDPLVEYRLPAHVAARTVFTGYLGRGRRVPAPAGPALPAARPGERVPAAPDGPAAPYALCLVGGGQDGAGLAEAFAATPFPDGVHGVLVTGPYLPDDVRERVHALAAERDDLDVHAFVRDVVPLVEGAAAVVTMGGYNSVCEVLAAERPALVVPRTHPRAEQLVRAERLAELGLLDVLTGDITPERLGAWVAGATRPAPAGATPPRPRAAVDLDGLSRVPDLVARLSAAARSGALPADPHTRAVPIFQPSTTQPSIHQEEHRATA